MKEKKLTHEKSIIRCVAGVRFLLKHPESFVIFIRNLHTPVKDMQHILTRAGVTNGEKGFSISTIYNVRAFIDYMLNFDKSFAGETRVSARADNTFGYSGSPETPSVNN